MILQDLFEKEMSTDPQQIDIKDPKMQYLVSKARSKYAYAKSDLEAFVKFMQDEVQDVEGEVHDVEKVNVKQQDEIEKQAKVDRDHERKLRDLEHAENKIEKQITKFDAVRQNIEDKIKQLDRATLADRNIER